mmetsp:Transcript_36098/g.90827  ORF Transcript_36098/g.90827 Transcript_36098/m.90827 type:complete len:231 (+) Transcript_36098:103-795(+)
MAVHDDGIFDTLPPFLANYGYTAESSSSWKEIPGNGSSAAASERSIGHPKLDIRVQGHEEAEGHTLYSVECSLSGPKVRQLDWSVKRRLRYFREGLHDPVKEHLGVGPYEQHFAGAPFAKKGGLPGTTSRLDTWCIALATCINARGCSPSMVAMVLHFFEVPEPRSAAETAKSAASSVADRFRNAAQSFANQVQQAPQQMQRSAEQAALGFAARNPNVAMSLASHAVKGL